MLKRAWQALARRRKSRTPSAAERPKRRRLTLECLEDRTVPVLFVAPFGADIPGAGSAALPFRSIQAAVNAAAQNEVIQVAGGTYVYDAAQDQLAAFLRVNSVMTIYNKALSIVGGYSNDFATRNPAANPSVIDGQNFVRGSFVLSDAAGSASLYLDGFVIQNCLARGEPGLSFPDNIHAFGGGMFINTAQRAAPGAFLFRDVSFRNNRAIGNDTSIEYGGAGSGGALALRYVSNLTLERVNFDNNEARGGAGAVRGGTANGGAIHFDNSQVYGVAVGFNNNRAIGGNTNGGGVSSGDAQKADGLGGAAAVQVNSRAVFQSVTATNNLAQGGNAGGNAGDADGGAFFAEQNSFINITDGNLRDNRAVGGNGANGGFAAGGAIMTQDSGVVLDRVQIVNNLASAGAGSNNAGAPTGGGLWLVRLTGSTTVEMTNVLVADNESRYGGGGNQIGGGGGGMTLQGVAATLTHVTVANNRLGSGLIFGQGILVNNDAAQSVTVVNINFSIIANHTNTNGAAALNVRQFPGAGRNVVNINRLMYANNSRDDNSGGQPDPAGTFNGLGTVTRVANAFFVAPGSPSFDYHIRSNSPAVGAATGSTTPVDLDSNPRTSPDLGAYEFTPPPPLARDSVGVYEPTTGRWFLQNRNGRGAPDVPVFAYGVPGWTPVPGDWDGNGTTTVGIFDPVTATWFLRNSNTPGGPDAGNFQFGGPGFLPVVGDWNGDGRDGIGAFDPATGIWYIRNSTTPGGPDVTPFAFGAPGWIPIAGDWDGDGRDGIGVFDPTTGTFYLRNTADAGGVSFTPFAYGGPGWTPLAGDWNNDGRDSLGVYDPSTGRWYLRNSISPGAPDAGNFFYGGPGLNAVAGDWDNFSELRAATLGAGADTLLTDGQLRSLSDAARRLFAQAGYDKGTLALLGAARIQVSSLPGDQLALASPASNQIFIDDDAAGHGWFIDPTPWLAEEFDESGRAIAGGPADGRMDLLTVLFHEMGHLAGLEDLDPAAHPDHLMAGTLAAGVRRS